MEVQKGDIAFSGKRASNWYSNGVKSITKSKWSHSFLLMGDACGELSVLEAELSISAVPWQREYVEKDADYYESYRPTSASQEDIDRATKYCYYNYSGEAYGFLEIPWFIYRIYMQRWFGYTPKKNWSSDGIFCSELVFDYLYQLGGEYRDLLKDFTPDTASPQDLYNLVLSRPDLFQFIVKRE